MTGRNKLVESASSLTPPCREVFDEYNGKKEVIAQKLTERMKERRDIDRLIGADNHSMMEDNHRNQMRFMVSLFENYDASVLVETVLWVLRTYRSHGFSVAYWPAVLDTCLLVMKEVLSSEAYGETEPFYEWLITNQASFMKISDEQIMGE